MKKLCMIVNDSTGAGKLNPDDICDYIEKRGGSCFILKSNQDDGNGPLEGFTDISGLDGDTEAVLVLGGDGTIIQAARDVVKTGIPILGINLGTVGFLAEAEAMDIYSAIDGIMDNKYRTEPHIMLKGRVIKSGKEVYSGDALNDIVVARSGTIRVISTEVNIDGSFLNRFVGDGVIVSTPTGSTGYNLSAGGAILMPDADVFSVTPVCPHSFNARGVVTSSSAKITVSIAESRKAQYEEALVSFDGNRGIKLNAGDRVEIEKATENVSFIRFEKFSFLNTLNRKMRNK